LTGDTMPLRERDRVKKMAYTRCYNFANESVSATANETDKISLFLRHFA